MLGWLLVVLAVLVGAFYALTGTEAGETLEGGEVIYIVACGALILLYLSTLQADYRGRALKALMHAGIWVGLGVLLVAGYSFRHEIGTVAYRVAGEVLPPGEPVAGTPDASGEISIRLRRQPGGHFFARAEINNASMTLLVDTGASAVVLKSSDAERAGIDTSSLRFSVPVQTANGVAYAAPARLRAVGIGPIVFSDVEALVAQPGTLKESLLGMSFLKRLRSYEFSGEFLTIRG